MEHNNILAENQMPDSSLTLERPEDFLSPEQRFTAITEILARMVLRSLNNDDDTATPKTN